MRISFAMTRRSFLFILLIAVPGQHHIAAEQCEAPVFHGIHLGMLASELREQYPDAKKERVSRKAKYYHLEVPSPFEGIEIEQAEVTVNAVKSCVTDIWISLHTSRSGDELDEYFRHQWGEPKLYGSAHLQPLGRWPFIGWKMGCGVDILFYRAALGQLPQLTYTESVNAINGSERKPCAK